MTEVNLYDSLISLFIWNKKSPRIRNTKETQPNHITWPLIFRSILHWYHINNQPSPWLLIEVASCGSSSLMSLLCLPLTPSPMSYSSNIIVKNCLKIWIKSHLGLQSNSLLSPVHSNPPFTASINDWAFALWDCICQTSLHRVNICIL